MAVALFPGTFDPVTLGHLELVERARSLFEKLIVAVGARADKKTLFSAEERVALVRQAVRGMKGVEVEPFDGLVVEFARKRGATVLVRGLRTAADFEYETQMAHTNRRLAPGVQTLFLVPSLEHAMVSSTLIREIALAGGSVEPFVPPAVAEALRRKLG